MASISICRHWQAVLFLQVCVRLFIAAREIRTAISVTVVQHHHRVQLLKSATFCSADTLALLLTDVLVFLQEKDQRFVFAAVVSLKLHSALEPEAEPSARPGPLHPSTRLSRASSASFTARTRSLL